MSESNGRILWEGNSWFDGKPIVVIGTGFARKSKNKKTGNMVQVFILRSDINPVAALKEREDVSICGKCELRDGRCYVNVGQAPLMVWKAYKAGRYRKLTDLNEFNGRVVRWGAYGDPAFIPEGIVREINSVCAGWTGYTHQWHRLEARWTQGVFQASCSTLGMVKGAWKLNFNVFAVGVEHEEIRVCDNYTSGVSCEDCLKCDGSMNIGIPAHGGAAVMNKWRKKAG